MTNKNGVIVQVINYGATVIKVVTPDKNGTFTDILLGSDNLKGNCFIKCISFILYNKFYTHKVNKN